jgi:hypothetical protein
VESDFSPERNHFNGLGSIYHELAINKATLSAEIDGEERRAK